MDGWGYFAESGMYKRRRRRPTHRPANPLPPWTKVSQANRRKALSMFERANLTERNLSKFNRSKIHEKGHFYPASGCSHPRC